MISIILGTRAQLVKMAPVIKEIESRNILFRLIFTGQHKESIDDLISDFKIVSSFNSVATRGEATGIFGLIAWFILCFWQLVRHKKKFFGSAKKQIVVVHGDTLSALIGAVVGKINGYKVAHVESGLRSFNIFHPFPEEITRLIVFRFTDIAYCPGPWACNNIKKYNLEVVDTGANTIVDALYLALHAEQKTITPAAQSIPFAIASIHRFENIFFRRRFILILDLIERAAEHTPIIFVLHPATKSRLNKFGLLKKLQANERISLVSRMGYVAFCQLLNQAEFVITDGGSNQEELYYLGKPTLLMRKHTERIEGKGSTMMIGNYDLKSLQTFLRNLDSLRGKRQVISNNSPSSLIVSDLQNRDS